MTLHYNISLIRNSNKISLKTDIVIDVAIISLLELIIVQRAAAVYSKWTMTVCGSTIVLDSIIRHISIDFLYMLFLLVHSCGGALCTGSMIS